MERIELIDLSKKYKEYIGKDIYVEGWIRNKRDSKNIIFINLNDGTEFNDVQIVVESDISNFDKINSLGLYSSILVKGKVVENQQNGFEIKAKEINIFAESAKDYPLQNKRHSFEYLRTIAHLRPRTNTFKAVFKIRSVISMAIHEFFQSQGFIYVQTPILTGSDAEGAGEMFNVNYFDLKNVPKTKGGDVDYSKDFFGKNVHLTVSGQLNAEAFAHSFAKTYTFGPTFRAENSNTVKHAAEFWMVEPEMAFTDLNGNMKVAEQMLKYVIKSVKEKAKEELEFCDKFIEKGLIKKLDNILNSDFGRITYTEAIEKLQKSGKKFENKVEWGIDLATEHERYIAEEIFKKPVFVIDYPKEIKAFYMKLNDDGKTVAAMDLLVPYIGEIIGGSQREENYEKLLQTIERNGLKKSEYSWYLDLRKYGSVVHSGFGLGLERLVMYITGMENIRDVIAFPRTPKHCEY